METRPRMGTTSVRAALALSIAVLGLGGAPGLPAQVVDSAGLVGPDREGRAFQHAQHRSVGCGVCHSIDERHRVRREWAAQDCAACHHGDDAPAGCTSCHDQERFAAPLRVAIPMELSVWEGLRVRVLSFEHEEHGEYGCLDCHRSGMSRPPVSCSSCHVDHSPEYECARCHVAPDPTVHDTEAHASCGGAGCHADEVLSRPMLSRPSCVVCHEEQQDHRPAGSCVACHIMPPRSETE